MKLRELRFLADENVSPQVVAFLRAQQLDVLDVKEQGWQGRADADLLATAHRESRWVLTHDADFGTLVVRQGHPFHGILYLRLKNSAPSNVITHLQQQLLKNSNLPDHALVVLGATKLRIRRPLRTP